MAYNQVNRDPKYLNLGCGDRFNPHWTNINFAATGEEVIPYDLSQGIPFADETFDFVYHSHVLEHFPKAAAVSFMQECSRVLRPGGILRVVVPDLEQIARLYLTSLDKASSSAKWAANYEWIVLELLDQMVRNSGGGEMATYLIGSKNYDRDLAIARCGAEASRLIASTKGDISSKTGQQIFKRTVKSIYRLLPPPLKRLVAALRIGYYRQGGEVHQWMYDRYSLSLLLQNCGLDKVVQRSATDSYLERWMSFNLDTEPDGTVYKPDSLFMEAIKPVHHLDLFSAR